MEEVAAGCTYLEHPNPSKTWFLLPGNLVFGGENLCFSMGFPGAIGNYKVKAPQTSKNIVLLTPKSGSWMIFGSEHLIFSRFWSRQSGLCPDCPTGCF